MPTWKSGMLLENALREMIDGLYLQVRDTVGGEIHSELSEQINNGLSKLFDDKLDLAITDGFQKKLPVIEGENNVSTKR